MKYYTLAALMLLAIIAYASAGNVDIRGKCIDCNTPRPDTHPAHTEKPKRGGGGGGRTTPRTTPKPKSGGPPARSPPRKSHADSDDDDDDWGTQTIGGGGSFLHQSGGRKHKRSPLFPQWRTSGGHVINGEGFPGTVVHNDDCRNCNIRG